MRFRIHSAVLAMLVVVPAGASAQSAGVPTTPAFQQVIRLAQDGYSDSARTLITRIIDRTTPTDPSYPEALFTAATVARSGEEMRLLFSRISLEYSRSAWADDALLRLGQLDYGAGNHAGTMSRVRRILNDFPTSPVIPEAALWGARAGFELKQNATACEWLARGVTAAKDDVETRNQLEFLRSRCTPDMVNAPMPTPSRTPDASAARTTPPRADSVRRQPASPTPAQASTGVSEAPWRVQVGALTDPAAIRRTMQQIEAAGFTAYTVAGPNGMTKIQAGPFATREAATAQLAKVKAAVNGAAFVTRVQ